MEEHKIKHPHIKVHEILMWFGKHCLPSLMRDNISLYDKEYYRR